jgi:hypothetical protein
MQKYIIDSFQEGGQSQRDANPATTLVPVTGRTMCPVQLASIRRTPGNTKQAYQKNPQRQSHFFICHPVPLSSGKYLMSC